MAKNVFSVKVVNVSYKQWFGPHGLYFVFTVITEYLKKYECLQMFCLSVYQSFTENY